MLRQRSVAFKIFYKAQRKKNPNVSRKSAMIDFEKYLQKNSGMLRVVDRAAREHAFTTTRQSDHQFVNEFFKKTEDWGVLSLTEEPNNILMWAHYCDCHKGFIFELDSEHPFFTTMKRHDPVHTIRKIIYREEIPHVKEHRDFLTNDGLDALLFTKDKRWQYEKEWRLIADRRDADKIVPVEHGEDIWLFKLPAECIKRVVLGCSMPPAKKLEFTAFLKHDFRYMHVLLQEAVRVRDSYNLEFREL